MPEREPQKPKQPAAPSKEERFQSASKSFQQEVDIREFIHDTAPADIDVRKIDAHLRSNHRGEWSSTEFELIVIHAAIRDASSLGLLERWRDALEKRIGIGIIVQPSGNFRDLKSSFHGYTIDGDKILPGGYLPALPKIVHGMHQPSYDESQPFFEVKRPALDFTEKETVVFDSGKANFSEELFYTEPLDDGKGVRLYGFYPDMTRYIPRAMKAPQTKYLLHAAVDILTSDEDLRVVSDQLLQAMTFVEGEERHAWGVVAELDNNGKLISDPKVVPFTVKNHKRYTFQDKGPAEGDVGYTQSLALAKVATQLSGDKSMSAAAVMEQLTVTCKQWIGQLLTKKGLPIIARSEIVPLRQDNQVFLERMKAEGLKVDPKYLQSSKGVSKLVRFLRSKKQASLANEIIENFMPSTEDMLVEGGDEQSLEEYDVQMGCNALGWTTQSQLSHMLNGTEALRRAQLTNLLHRIGEQQEDFHWHLRKVGLYNDIHRAFGAGRDKYTIATNAQKIDDQTMLVKIRGFKHRAQLNLEEGESVQVEALGKEPIPVKFLHYSLEAGRIILSLNQAGMPS